MSLAPLREPTSYAAVNAAWQWRGDVPLLRYAATLATVLGVVEARTRTNEPVEVGRILGRLWRVAQDTRDGATASTALAVRTFSQVRLKRVSTWISNRAGSWRTSVQTRRMKIGHVVDNGIRTRVIVLHFAIVNSGQQHQSKRALARAVRRAERAGVRWIVLGDFNTNVHALARELGADWCHAVDVMGAFGGAPESAKRDGRGWGHIAKDVRRHDKTDHGIPVVTETHRRIGAKGVPA